MSSIFHDQQLFMTATEQAPNAPLYRELVKEEAETELTEAWEKFSHESVPEIYPEDDVMLCCTRGVLQVKTPLSLWNDICG